MSKAMVHTAVSELRSPGDFGRIADTIGSPECHGTGNCPPTFRKTEKDSLTDVTREWNLQAILLFARISARQMSACYPRHGSRKSFFRTRATAFEGACSMTYQPIENYGMIGDMHTVALVGTDGSIDWLCVPRFDSPSVFAAILDDGRGGRFKIAPVGDDVTCKQFYWPETNVLITRF